MQRSVSLSMCWLLFVLMLAVVAPLAQSQEAPKTKAKGRLPAYYKDIVSAQQRDKIYEIQSTYSDQIDKLMEQVKTLQAKRDAEIDALLTAEQKQQIAKKKAENGPKKPAEPAPEKPAPKTSATPTTPVRPVAKPAE